MGVKTSPTPGLVEAKFPNPANAKKAYRFEAVATYAQLKALMGPASLDRYLLGGESRRWDLPKRKERDLEKGKKGSEQEKEKEKEKESDEQNAGFRDDSLPESAEQIMPDEEAEGGSGEESEEVEEDAVTKAAKEADDDLRMELDKSNDD